MLSVEQINLLETQNEELRVAYNAILESCKKEQAENEKLKGWREKSNKTIKKLSACVKNYISAWNKSVCEINDLKSENETLKKYLDEEREDYDKLQGVYQNEHCDLLELKKTLFQAQNAAINTTKQSIKYEQALKEIKSIAQNLYYQSIKDPVKREKATYDIIEKVNSALAV